MKARLLQFLLTTGLLLASVAAYPATQAGEEIVNQAIITYTDADTGETVELLSNSARVQISELRQFDLTASQSATRLPGESVAFVHTLKNTGNVDDVYSLELENTLADSTDLNQLALFIDGNENGIVDTGEELLDSQLIALQPDEALSVIVTGVVPLDAAYNSNIVVEIAAFSIDDDTNRKTNQDEVIVSAPVSLSIVLSNNPTCDVPVASDQVVNYDLVVSNGSDALPVEQDYDVGGVTVTGVLIELAIPARLIIQKSSIVSQANPSNTAFLIRTQESGSQWLIGDDWDSVTPITHLATIIPAADLGRNVERKFKFSANLALSGTDDESATVELVAVADQDADGRSEVVSNTVCNVSLPLGPAIEAVLRFVKPELGLQRAGEPPTFSVNNDFRDSDYYILDENNTNYSIERDGVYVELQAIVSSDRPLAKQSTPRFVDVLVRSALTGDTIRLVLREVPSMARMGNSDGSTTHIYRSIRPLTLSTESGGNGRWCPGGDISPDLNTAQYENADSVCVLRSDYDDKLTVTFNDDTLNTSLLDTARVNPVSLVFDSTTLRGVEDALITVYSGDNVARHPITDEELIFKSDELGRFVLPLLSEDINYSIEVNPPEEYLFPSNVPADSFPDLEVNNASYGGNGFNGDGNGRFAVAAGDPARVIDIPLDPTARESLMVIDKTTDTPVLDIGEVANYRIVLKNQGESRLENVTIIDTPPRMDFAIYQYQLHWMVFQLKIQYDYEHQKEYALKRMASVCVVCFSIWIILLKLAK